MASVEATTPKSVRSSKSTAAERRLAELAGDGEAMELRLPNFRSAVFDDGASPGRRALRAQRTAMLAYDSEASSKTLSEPMAMKGRQRTAMLADIRISRTATEPPADDVADCHGGRDRKSSSWSSGRSVFRVAADAKSSVQGFIARGVRSFR